MCNELFQPYPTPEIMYYAWTKPKCPDSNPIPKYMESIGRSKDFFTKIVPKTLSHDNNHPILALPSMLS
jgi:hypothetical protein